MRACALVLLAACWGTTPPRAAAPPPAAPHQPTTAEIHAHQLHARPIRARVELSPMEEAFARWNEFTDALCDCPDNTCTQRVQDEMMRWGTDWTAAHPDIRPSEDDMKQVMEISERWSKCMSKPSPAP